MTSTFYPPLHIGGDAVHVKYLAEELAGRGHEVHVLHSVDAYRLKRGGSLPEMDSTAVHLHRVETSIGRASPVLTFITGSNRRAETLLEQLVAKEKPDWIHHHNVSLLGAELLSVGAAPKLYTAHDYWLICQRNDLLRMGRTECEDRKCFRCALRSLRPPQIWRHGTIKKAISGIDLFIAPSAFMASVLRRDLGIEAKVIPNFAPRPPAPEPSADARKHFLFASVLERHKGLDLLLEAYGTGRVDAELHVTGRGTLEGLVRERQKESGSKIRYLGYVSREELLSEIGSAIALVLPSQWPENSPLSCIEALALGTPIIVSGRGGLPELVNDPQTGLVCGSSASDLSEILHRMEGDADLRSALSRNARERYETIHTPEHYVQAYMNLVEEALAS